MLKKIVLSFGLACATMTGYAQNELVTNHTIIDLLKEGFNSEEIQGLIEGSAEREITFNIAFMRELKSAGASSELITYLQKIAKTDHGYEGVLWWNPTDGGQPVKLYQTSFEKESKGGFGAVAAIAGTATGILGGSRLSNAASIGLLTSGGGVKKVVMQGANARIVMKGENALRPVFRFYFPKEEHKSFDNTPEGWLYSFYKNVESPNEFQCIKMKQKKSKRSFPDGISYTIAGFTAEKSTRNIIDFDIMQLDNHTFEVSFKEPLEPGEYCFFYKNASKNPIFAEHMFGFDFSIQE